ncbi:DNA cytosine methyltransferase [Hymenobacter gummosus]|uniref:DNA (cytosine-5-)-methyltransferase n=1 Tax=Hymenobacter gummosus TaxID=1776032 RepID=A0A431TUJ4_9BACT|nr:DNA cytosine methyltransferase [Hymenobacter gummosus]
MKLYNHIAPKLSDLEWQMIQHIPAGGNWQHIPDTIPSQRLVQIRKSGGRTTYYGRLEFEKPSYTITTYFNRLGNGCNLHPAQNRIISTREAARLQSFRDGYVFKGSKTSQYKQIGNAVPTLLARAVAAALRPHLQNHTYIDLFAGAGGMSEGFLMDGYQLLGANEIESNYFETYRYNHTPYDTGSNFVLGDITEPDVKSRVKAIANGQRVGVVVGGPPCQGFSTAGWRDPNDDRNQLFKDFLEIVRDVRPEFFVMENVPGILSMRKGAALREIVEAFEEIGYFVNKPFRLTAQEFGVPQKRKRVMIVGSLNPIPVSQPKPLFSYDSDSLPDPINVREAIGSLPPLISGGGTIETEYTPENQSAYEQLMTQQIDFQEFYARCFARPKVGAKSPRVLSLFS